MAVHSKKLVSGLGPRWPRCVADRVRVSRAHRVLWTAPRRLPGGDASLADAVADEADALVDSGPRRARFGVHGTASMRGVRHLRRGARKAPTRNLPPLHGGLRHDRGLPDVDGDHVACRIRPRRLLSNNCIKTCTGDTDCTAPFICRSDVGTTGTNACWSPYPPIGGAKWTPGQRRSSTRWGGGHPECDSERCGCSHRLPV